MSIISSASGSSCWRGLEYYNRKQIKSIKKISDIEYTSIACGTKEYEEYQENEYRNMIKAINKMSKKQLIEELIYIFDYAPEWVYNDFVKRNDING